jgi:hypothetical protein
MPIRFIARTTASVVALVMSIGAASAAEPSGCAAFKWPVDRERAVLTGAEALQLASGAELDGIPAKAMALKLRPATDAALPTAPERPPATDRFAGFVRIKQVAKPGTYTIALSAGGWIDAVHGERTLKPTGFSGATDCDGVRKLVRYDLAAGDLLLQVSGVAADTITFALLPVE